MRRAFNKFAKYEEAVGAGLGGLGGYYATGKNNKDASFGDKMRGAFAGATIGGLAGHTVNIVKGARKFDARFKDKSNSYNYNSD